MKTLLSMGLVVVLAVVASAQEGTQTKEAQFFDMKNCEICKCMEHMDMSKVGWKSHKIDKGMLTVTVIPDSMKGQWASCKTSMDNMIKKAESGEVTELCGFCNHFGELMKHGVKKQEIESIGGHLVLVTSDDAEVVKKIHALADRIEVEHKKMMEMMMKQGHGTEGHSMDTDG